MEQKIIYANYMEVREWLAGRKIFLVCGNTFDRLRIKECFEGIDHIRYGNYTPNPKYESITEGTALFKQSGCNAIAAVGGGSTIDVAKCIKLESGRDVPFFVMPTTAGTGSEATRFAVIYKDGEKMSVTHDMCMPDTVLFDADALNSLSEYQRKATMLDALCHAIESYWSIRANKESKGYSQIAIQLILENWRGYINKDAIAQGNMLKASNIAGKAINITQTTAGHAMCYKLTTLYGIAHGHAAALCVSKLWVYMLEHLKDNNDSKGYMDLQGMFDELASVMECRNSIDAASLFQSILEELDLGIPDAEASDFNILNESVNIERLKNNPMFLDKDSIDFIYHEILKG